MSGSMKISLASGVPERTRASTVSIAVASAGIEVAANSSFVASSRSSGPVSYTHLTLPTNREV